jgi:sulfite oxidase
MPMDYTEEPPHSQLLKVQGSQPFNAEPKSADLVEFNVTPEELVYCRNHGPVRVFDEDKYVVSVKDDSSSSSRGREISLSMRDIVEDFAKVEIVAALQASSIPLLGLASCG